MVKVLFQRLDAGKVIHSINPIILQEIFTILFYGLAFLTPAENTWIWLPAIIIGLLLTLDLFIVIVLDDWLRHRKEKKGIH